eukprot:CAMPEP_0194163888 /NCGR_PEP_ID=MMETSP0152-20130528/80295_1 /TAXON_ID=1049557 /ORGANISM="Thalassiothrix antarctica, Strain L6-D1" /LENGTH=46 /DNA_ID= /DNA_START= /DNA_END= /DNA_ORIENTATION=
MTKSQQSASAVQATTQTATKKTDGNQPNPVKVPTNPDPVNIPSIAA